MMRRVALVAAFAVLAGGCTGGGASQPAGEADTATLSASGAPVDTERDLTAARSSPVADPVYPDYGNPAIDVLHYDLALTWRPDDRQLAGLATVTIRTVKPANKLALDFDDVLAVDEAHLDGRPVRVSRDADDLVVSAERRIPADDQVTLVVRYHGSPQGAPGPVVRDDLTTIGWHTRADGSVFALQEPYGAFTWFPSNDQPSDEALLDVSVTVPDGWAGVSNGTLTGAARKDGVITYQWRAAEPVATYLVALGIDRYREVTDAGPRGLAVSYWIPQDRDDLGVFAMTPDLIAWLEQRFGPYPFASAGAMHIDEFTGMETQTMITLPMDASPAILLHELAHQWFGDSVTPRDWRDMWLNEGWAMYAQVLYEEDRLGVDLDDRLADFRKRDARLRAEHGPPARYIPGHFGSPNVYYPPALMLHAIRQQIGDTQFFAMAREWVQKHRNTTQDRASFTSFVNDFTGRDFTSLIDVWLDSATTPAA
jgi:aminopeptidase N